MSTESREYSQIVIGGNLEALSYAYKNNLPIISTSFKPPFEYDYFQPSIDLGFLNLDSQTELISTSGTITVGVPKAQVWQKLLFLLAMSGKVLYGDSVRSLTVEEHKIFISCEGAKRREIRFEQLVIFDDDNIVGLPAIESQVKHKNIVYDWVNIVSGGKHEYDIFQYDDDFVKTVHFYPSHRNCNTKQKDLVCISHLTDEEAVDFSFSGTYVKFKLLGIMKDLGIRGARNGRDVNDPTKYKYYAVKLEPTSREVVKRVSNEYEQDDRFVFLNRTAEDILMDDTAIKGYTRRLTERL